MCRGRWTGRTYGSIPCKESTCRLSVRVWCLDTRWCLCILIYFYGVYKTRNHDLIFTLVQDKHHLIIRYLTQSLELSTRTRSCIHNLLAALGVLLSCSSEHISHMKITLNRMGCWKTSNPSQGFIVVSLSVRLFVWVGSSFKIRERNWGQSCVCAMKVLHTRV